MLTGRASTRVVAGSAADSLRATSTHFLGVAARGICTKIVRGCDRRLWLARLKLQPPSRSQLALSAAAAAHLTSAGVPPGESAASTRRYRTFAGCVAWRKSRLLTSTLTVTGTSAAAVNVFALTAAGEISS